jgi:ribosome maturation factor RimP
MISEKIVRKIIEAELKGSENFLVEVLVRSGNRIHVFIDSDKEVIVDDCVRLSRHLEGKFDRDDEDFDLMVSSAGLDQPFKQIRQYHKYLNRRIEIQVNENEKITAILTDISEEEIAFKKLTTKQKSKAAVEGPEERLPLSEIKETKPAVHFGK